VYSNGAPIADIPANADFYRDFPAGTYRFTVQPYGIGTGETDTAKVAPGTQTWKSNGHRDGRWVLRVQARVTKTMPLPC
jgi:hypothetical protein